MELELLMRKEKMLSTEQKKDYNVHKLLPDFDEDEFLEQVKDYEYVPVTIDIRDALPFLRVDAHHTQIFLRGCGLAFVARIEYERFQTIRLAMLGTYVKSSDDFMFEPKTTKSTKRTK